MASSKALKKEVFTKADFKCKKCHKEFPTDQLDVHLPQPKIKSGPAAFKHAQTFCKKHHRQLHKDSNSLEEYNFELRRFNIPEPEFEIKDNFIFETDDIIDIADTPELEAPDDLDEDFEDEDDSIKSL